MNKESAIATIRRLESNPKTLAQIILNRSTDPRWQELQDAYQAVKGAWFLE